MNKEQKAALLKEARMQMQAIRTLEKYNMAALALSDHSEDFVYHHGRQ